MSPSNLPSTATSVFRTPLPPDTPVQVVKRSIRELLDQRWVQLLLLVIFGLASIAIAVGYSHIPPYTLHDPLDTVAVGEVTDTDDVQATAGPLKPNQRNEDIIGGVASRDIRASHDFKRVEIRDIDAERERAEAARRVTPIWAFDATVDLDINARVLGGFDFLRGVLCTQSFAENVAEEGEDEAALEQKRSAAVRTCQQRGLPDGLLSAKERAEIACGQANLDRLRARLALPSLSSDACKLIAADGASVDTQRALQNYVSDLLLKPVVANDAALNEIALALAADKPKSEKGIRVSHQSRSDQGSRYLQPVSDMREFRTVAQLGDAALQESDSQLDENVPDALKPALREIAAGVVAANLRYDRSATESEREDIAGRALRNIEARGYRRGSLILPKGSLITRDVAETVAQMNATAPRSVKAGWEAFALGVLLFVVGGGIWFISRDAKYRWSTRDITMMGLVLLTHVALIRLAFYTSGRLLSLNMTADSTDGANAAVAVLIAAPFAAGPMVVRILTNTRNALAFTTLASIIVAAMGDYNFAWFSMALVSGMIGTTAMGQADSRSAIVRGVAAAGVSVALMAVAFGARGLVDSVSAIALVSLAALAGFITNSLVALSMPYLIEVVFRYTTPFRLRELMDMTHPLVRELGKAPGTLTHSSAVADLTAEACNRIGANALLGHVGAYYHDIGKTRAPEFFGENNYVPNPHDALSYRESARVIIRHVPDGVELGRRYNLPEEVIQFIATHHGTTMVRHFFNKTAQEEGIENVDEAEFTYPGPIPSTKETAICLLADGIEASVRAQPDKSPHAIQATVNKMINSALSAGQLNDSNLTLRDLEQIAQAFVERLKAMHHSRPQYAKAPQRATSEDAQAPLLTSPVDAHVELPHVDHPPTGQGPAVEGDPGVGS